MLLEFFCFRELLVWAGRFHVASSVLHVLGCRAQCSHPQLAATSRQDMVYFSGGEASPAYNKAREFSQKISTVGVDGRNKES